MSKLRDENHTVQWRTNRPDFEIRVTHGFSTSRGYHETFYEVVNHFRQLDKEDFEHLSQTGLLGSGQAYDVRLVETIVEEASPVTVDKRNGKVLVDLPPVSYIGEPITDKHPVNYFKYVVRRICDSGD